MTHLTLAQMHVRLMRLLPQDLARNVSPRFVGEQCQIAHDNGWRDPEWLANVALEGTGMGNVTNAAAMFTQQLKEAAATDCPEAATPTPRLPDDYWRTERASDPGRYVAEARRLLDETRHDGDEGTEVGA